VKVGTADIDLPDVVAEVRAAFERYERALVANDIGVLDELFWHDPRVQRFGIAENLYGIDAIRAFRQGRPAAGLARTLERTEIHTFGRDCAVANTEFYRGDRHRCGRQSQTWVRLALGWRIVSAHVSLIEVPQGAGPGG
jgi:hypothetical protein